MAYVELPEPKKNSLSTTIAAPGINDSDVTIPVAELSVFYDDSAALILEGITIARNDATESATEEIKITGASGTSGAGNLTGATRAVSADGTNGAAAAWVAGTIISVQFTSTVLKRIKDNLADHETNKAPIASPTFTGNVTIPAGTHSLTVKDFIKLQVLGAMIPTTNYVNPLRAETTTNKVNYVYGDYTQAGDGVNRLQWEEILKEDWKSDGNLTIKFFWLVAAGTAGHTVKWEIFGKQLTDDDPMDTALVSIGTAEDAITAAGDVQVTTTTTPAAISGTAGDIAIFEIQRIASSGTETTENARLLGASVLYTRVIT